MRKNSITHKAGLPYFLELQTPQPRWALLKIVAVVYMVVGLLPIVTVQN